MRVPSPRPPTPFLELLAQRRAESERTDRDGGEASESTGTNLRNQDRSDPRQSVSNRARRPFSPLAFPLLLLLLDRRGIRAQLFKPSFSYKTSLALRS